MAYNTPLVWRKALLAGAEEAISGTAETTAIAGAMAATQVMNASIEEAVQNIERPALAADLSSLASVPGLAMANVSFETEASFGDTSMELLTAAGFKLAGLVYSPTSDFSARKTWSFGHFTDGNKKLTYGVALDLEIALAVGQTVPFRWNGQGIWGGQTAVALPVNPTFSAIPLQCTGMVLTHGAGPTAWAQPRAVTIKLNNSIVLREDAAKTAPDTTGLAHAYVVRGTPTIEIDPETLGDATLDNYALKTAGTLVAFKAVLYTTSVAQLTIDAPQVQRLTVAQAERDGYRTDRIVLACRRSTAGDDELTFTFRTGW